VIYRTVDGDSGHRVEPGKERGEPVHRLLIKQMN